MKRETHYLTAAVIREISKLNIKIESTRCRQIKLLNADKLSELTRKNETSDFNSEAIIKLWQLGFIQSDVVRATNKIDIDGIILISDNENVFYYADERILQEKPEGYSDAFAKLKDLPKEIELLFHPFRCYVLYHIHRTFSLNISSVQTILNSKGLNELITWHINFFNDWTSKPETIQLFKYWNNITALCAVSEPTAHRIIFHKVSYGTFDSYEAMVAKLRALHSDVNGIYKSIGEISIEFYRKEICQTAEMIDPNKDLHLIIRLMNGNERTKLKGDISAAILFLTMAENLRRNLEETYDKKYPEEDEQGFGEVFQNAKLLIQGSTRVLDEDRIVANQFLRRFGLDYGIRVNIYAEGDTEYEALNSEFATNSSVLIINLKGSFIEKQGKGIAFRESLRNDLKSKTFSLILLDGDRTDNLRVVKQAAEADEICGMFFVATPDFEIANFAVPELSKITYQLSQEKGIKNIELIRIEEATKDAKSAKDFFTAINNLSPDLSRISKGKDWGQALSRYAVRNPKGQEFGDINDRLLNRVITIAYQCTSYTYETTRQKYKVDPQTGELLERK